MHSELSQLKTAIANGALTEEQKLNVTVDVESLKDQLVKAVPDKTIVGHIWSRIEQVATMGGFVDAIQRVAPLISGLLPS